MRGSRREGGCRVPGGGGKEGGVIDGRGRGWTVVVGTRPWHVNGIWAGTINDGSSINLLTHYISYCTCSFVSRLSPSPSPSPSPSLSLSLSLSYVSMWAGGGQVKKLLNNIHNPLKMHTLYMLYIHAIYDCTC